MIPSLPLPRGDRRSGEILQMTHIVVDDELAKTILKAMETLEVRDRSGQRLGYVTPNFTAEEVATARKRLQSDETRYSTQEVLDHLQSLDET